MSVRSDNHDSKAATASKIHSIAEREGLPGPAIHLERIIDRAVITSRATLFHRESLLRRNIPQRDPAENRISLLAL